MSSSTLSLGCVVRPAEGTYTGAGAGSSSVGLRESESLESPRRLWSMASAYMGKGMLPGLYGGGGEIGVMGRASEGGASEVRGSSGARTPRGGSGGTGAMSRIRTDGRERVCISSGSMTDTSWRGREKILENSNKMECELFATCREEGRDGRQRTADEDVPPRSPSGAGALPPVDNRPCGSGGGKNHEREGNREHRAGLNGWCSSSLRLRLYRVASGRHHRDGSCRNRSILPNVPRGAGIEIVREESVRRWRGYHHDRHERGRKGAVVA